MAQLKNVVDPFGEVNVHPAPGGLRRVVATILMTPYKEGTQTGIALDGSGSMRRAYGDEGGGRVLSPIFGGSAKPVNEMTPVAQKICAYLARNLDADGGTSVIYWAVGTNGSQIEVVGDLSASQAEQHRFGPPKDYGTGTQLLPALKYFCERFKDAPWGFYVFITDGELHDLDEVMAFSKQLCQEIAARRRNPLKLVLIGLGKDVNEYQMSELDDLDTGTDIDLWDHKLAADMRTLEQIFAEVVDRNARVADHGKIKTPDGKIVADFTDKGLPAYLEFTVPAEVMYFTLEVNGQQIHQTLDDAVPAPPSSTVKEAAPEIIDHLPVDNDPSEQEWKGLSLEFGSGPSSEGDKNLDIEKAD
ncbi:MAG: VWA domain-containing protein [Planctomycetia bacterium]|nr:VWA domain-containing protein [Planctomycetia bacterium]